MILGTNHSADKQAKKTERLSFIKERYRKLVLEPRKEIEFEIERALDDDDGDMEPS